MKQKSAQLADIQAVLSQTKVPGIAWRLEARAPDTHVLVHLIS